MEGLYIETLKTHNMKKLIIITLVLLAALVSACTENTNTKRESYPPRVSTLVKSYYTDDTELQEVDFRGHLYIIARCGNRLAIIHSDNCDCMIDYD